MSDMESRAPSPYEELVGVLEALPVLVREKRRRLRLTMRAAERATGVGMSTFSRVENGHDMALTTALDLLRWVGTPDAQPPTATAMQPPPAGIGQDGPDQTEPQEKP